jgi:hypothetical protein
MATKARIEPQPSPVPVDIPKQKSLSERLIDVIDEYGSERNLDPQLLMDSVARAVSNIDRELKARLRQFEDEQRRAEFQKAYDERQVEYALAINGHPFPYKVKRIWVATGKAIVDVAGFRKSIFAEKEGQ